MILSSKRSSVQSPCQNEKDGNNRTELKLFFRLSSSQNLNNKYHITRFRGRYKILTSEREFDLRPRVVLLFLWNSLFSDCVTNIILSGARGLVFSSRVWGGETNRDVSDGKMVITVIILMRIFIDFSLHIYITFNSSHHYTRMRKLNQN